MSVLRRLALTCLVGTFSSELIFACQWPPGGPPSLPPQVSVQCHLSADVGCATAGQPFRIYMTVTNMDLAPPLPPPYNDDQTFTVYASASSSLAVNGGPTGGEQEDMDGDYMPDDFDNCPAWPDRTQLDTDVDGIGDACDNCPLVANATQDDADGDRIGDACDIPGGDADADTVLDDADNCATIANATQVDQDSDLVGDACDNCLETPNPDRLDQDGDAVGDACDNCPSRVNPASTLDPGGVQADTDGDGTGDACDLSDCWPTQRGFPGIPVAPDTTTIRLDDAWSPFVDEPTTTTVEMDVLMPPDEPGAYVWVTVYDQFGRTLCSQELCVLACEQDVPTPSARFADPEILGDAGGQLQFALSVDRHGYSPADPLTVQLVRENFSDPVDVFPIVPIELMTTGVTVTSETATIPFSCGLHGPCFAGVSNSLHAVITNATTGEVVLDTRDRVRQGIGRATVARAPMAMQEILAVEDSMGDGQLEACEPARLRVRFIARNPFIGTPLESVALDAQIPPGFLVDSYALHYHDNPMDTYTPTPAELDAVGTVTWDATTFHVDVTEVEARYAGTLPAVPAPVFRDLFEADVVLSSPGEGPGPIPEVVFARLTVTSTPVPPGGPALPPRTYDSTDRRVPVLPSLPPDEVSGPASFPLRWLDRENLLWTPEMYAARFNLYRGGIAALHAGPAAECLAPDVLVPMARDAELPGPGAGFFYLVAGENCAGEGPLGTDSRGIPRPTRTPCP